eukprot:360874-Chlamydomonas_euryale.AAC.14
MAHRQTHTLAAAARSLTPSRIQLGGGRKQPNIWPFRKHACMDSVAFHEHRQRRDAHAGARAGSAAPFMYGNSAEDVSAEDRCEGVLDVLTPVHTPAAYKFPRSGIGARAGGLSPGGPQHL